MDNRDKFTNKAENYTKYRPSYPQGFINHLVNEVGMNCESIVADIGAGTGILTKLLACKVKKIIAVEPNKDMLKVCRKHLKGIKNFTGIDASAENTSLPDSSVDFITAAQAFHWFDREKSKSEFKRILKKNGKVIIVWNFKYADYDFLKENRSILRRFCPEFKGFTGGVENDSSSFSDFFKKDCCEYKVFDNYKTINLEEFIGGTLSASYSPSPEVSHYNNFISELTEVFNKYSTNGILKMPLKTWCYTGEL